MNKRYNEQDPAPQYDPETARIRRALRAQKARRRKKMRSRRLFLLGMALILLFVLVPNLWGTVDALLQMEEHSADGETLQGFPYNQMNHYVKKITSCYARYQRIYAES